MLVDETWETVLATLKTEGEFSLDELPFEQSELVGVWKILRRLEDKNWVQQDGELWKPGAKAQMLLELDGGSLENGQN
ncbi:hypothetical protein [Haloplanus salinus]|jgi:hypothetical protein|uniref:hypothetical protein n=1 Tax=Haloplanus salinus TaxID=1126245 RepID=UPI0011C0650E|nr:hypothetical protein [Haloplanus salinus]